jgi:hypothetical protein
MFDCTASCCAWLSSSAIAVVVDRHVEDLDVGDAHAVLGEAHAGAGAAVAGLAQHRVADDLDRRAVEGLDRHLLDRALEHAAHVVAQELHVVLDLEPLGRLALEVDPHRVLEGDGDVVGGLDHAAVADLVVEHAQEDRLDQLVGGLGLAGRQLDHLEGLVVPEQQVDRPLLDAAAALLVDHHHRVADPGVDRRHALGSGCRGRSSAAG